jgi:hypothetical protein
MLGKILDIIAFFCITTDLYANKIPDLQEWAKNYKTDDGQSLSSALVQLPIVIIVGLVGGVIAVGSVTYIWSNLQDVFHVLTNGLDRQWLSDRHSGIHWTNDVMDYVQFIFVWIVFPLVIMPTVIAWAVGAFFYSIFISLQTPLRLLVVMAQRYTFKRVLLFTGAVAFLAARGRISTAPHLITVSASLSASDKSASPTQRHRLRD